MKDDLVRWGDEGRGKHRYASGSRKQALIRGFPNGETFLIINQKLISEFIADVALYQANWNI